MFRVNTKSIFSSLIVFLTCFLFSNQNVVNAEEQDYWFMTENSQLQSPDKIWNIDFTCEIDEDSINNESIYILDSENKEFKYTRLEVVDEDTIKVIPTEEYEQGQSYFLCIDSQVKTVNGTSLIQPSKLKFTIGNVDSDFFKIRNVKPISKNVIEVYFTQPINEDVELELYYDIKMQSENFVQGSFKTMDVKRIKGIDNGIRIFLKENEFIEGKQYNLKIVGDLTSNYGVRLLDGLGDQRDFLGTGIENEQISVESVQAVNNNTVVVTFNKELDSNSAERIINYSISDNTGVPKGPNFATMSKDGKKVILKTIGTLSKTGKYNILIRNIKDCFGVTSIKQENYIVKLNMEDNIAISEVVPLSENEIAIYFDKIPDPQDVINNRLYRINGESDSKYYASYPNKVSYDEVNEPYLVRLYMDRKFIKNEEYKLRISKYLKDEYGSKLYSDLEYLFKGVDTKNQDIYIKECVVIGDKQVKVKFSQEIMSNGTNLDPKNYLLECNEGESRRITLGCSNVKYINGTTIILTFDDLNSDEDYLLKIDKLTDIRERSIETYKSGINVIYGK